MLTIEDRVDSSSDSSDGALHRFAIEEEIQLNMVVAHSL